VEQRRAYFEELNDCHDPIQRLPVEIVASVFSFCSPRLASLDVFNVGGETIAIHPIQFVLGSVCRYWRLVVCSTPQMWNIIRVFISFCTPEVHSELLAEWLGHSGQLPLYVSMSYDTFDYYHENRDGPRPGTIAWSSIHRMMNMLSLNANRIRVLHLSLLGSQFSCWDANPVTDAVTTTSCILEELSIKVLGFEPPIFELPGRVLSPTHVSLQDIKPLDVGIQWEHVTRVEAMGVPIKEALEVLKLAPRLQYLKLKIYHRETFGEGPILHSSLKYLDLDSALANSLDFIICPALEELSNHQYYDLVILQNFINRSKCPLKRLTLQGPHTTNQLVSILRLAPSLTHLSLKEFGFLEFLEIFMKIAYFEQGTPERGNLLGLFLPDLSSFTCTPNFVGFPWSKMPSLIPRSRNDMNLVCRPLSGIEIVVSQKVGVYGAEFPMNHEGLRQTLEHAREGGISLKIMNVDGVDLIRHSMPMRSVITRLQARF